MPEPVVGDGSSGLTRRQALAAGACAGLALVAPPWALGAAAAAAEPATLSAERVATLRALLSALAEGPAAGLADSAKDAYVSAFAAFYAAAQPPFRAYADPALDELAPLASAQPAAAYAQLVQWGAERQTLAATALALASLTFEEDEARQPGYALVAA